MRRVGVGAGAVLIAGLLAAGSGAAGPVAELALGGFTFEKSTTVPGSPEEAFDAFTGDVSGWWDHHISENPKELVIEPRPGGAFREVFDDEGNGAIHADVIYAHRGKQLTLRGPLGLTGNATDFVYTIVFEAVEGDSTRVALTARAAGQMDPAWGEIVAQVWEHFLVEQYREWVIGGAGK